MSVGARAYAEDVRRTAGTGARPGAADRVPGGGAGRFVRAASVVGLAAAVALGPPRAAAQETVPTSGETAIVIHGGAGTILPGEMTDEQEAAYRSKLREALLAGHGVLEEGGEAVDAVVAAIRVMEESPLFNAGVGAVFTSEGTVEHDASIMEGRTRNAGAVAGVKRVPSPIAVARLVMDSSRHVMLAQEGAETFAQEQGIELVPNETFYTERRRRAWERANQGTVGAAALDRDGDLAAGTSTGGISNKRFGRIGDSPIIGAGTYADNATAAISATGHGEFFIRGAVAHDIVSMMRYAGLSLAAAANAVVHGTLVELAGPGSGGVIALDREGNVAMPFNTPGMYRGYVDTEGNVVVKIYRD